LKLFGNENTTAQWLGYEHNVNKMTLRDDPMG
jgi:hypothetical protein